MSDHAHQGAGARSPIFQPLDRRVSDLDNALSLAEQASGVSPVLGFERDPSRGSGIRQQRLGYSGQFVFGTVIHALPFLNWYKVECGHGVGSIGAVLPGVGGNPLGPRKLQMVRPGDSVLVRPSPHPGRPAIIEAILPATTVDGRWSVPDHIVQGGRSGYKREEAHRYPLTSMFQSGGAVNWSSGRPVDQTPFEEGWITPTGLAITIDDFLIQLRVHEMCGIWLTLYDGWMRLAAQQLLLETPIHEEAICDDEGEARYFRGVAAYPYEAIGLSQPGTAITRKVSPSDAQYKGVEATTEPLDPKLLPGYRYVEYGGYLGQGHFRAVVKPSFTDGKRSSTDETPDVGLFREAITLKGDFSSVAAGSYHIGRRTRIIVPKPKTSHDSPVGDDAANGTYKFSGLYGTGQNHVVQDVRVTGDVKSARRAAGVQDLIAYEMNWKVLHPFHYHTGDYHTVEEKDYPHFPPQGALFDYTSIANNAYLDDPVPTVINIDHRYGNVEFFDRESFLRFHEDGTVQMVGPGGEQLLFAGGRVRLEGPAVEILSGTDLILVSDQMILKAYGSVDLSSSSGDMRFAAANNMHFNGVGMLFESSGEGNVQIYENRYGEDVVSTGITFMSRRSGVSFLGGDIYLRTGGSGFNDGQILLDAGQGNGVVSIAGAQFTTYTTESVIFAYGPNGRQSKVEKVYLFGKDVFVVEAQLQVRDEIFNFGDNAWFTTKGGISALDQIATADDFVSSTGDEPGKLKPGTSDKWRASIQKVAAGVTDIRKDVKKQYEQNVIEGFYAEGRPGDDTVLATIGFSYRDPPPEFGTQYRVSGLKWPETRWQMLARFGLATGANKRWTERPILYQGRETHPWPGKEAWENTGVFLQIENLTIVDPATGVAKDRTSDVYSDPTLAGWASASMRDSYNLIGE